MTNRIVAVGLAGWGLIVLIAAQLATWRMDLCDQIYGSGERISCLIRTTTARDFVIVAGLIVALLALLAVAVARVRSRHNRLTEWFRPATPSQRVHRLERHKK